MIPGIKFNFAFLSGIIGATLMMLGDWLMFGTFWTVDASTFYASYIDQLAGICISTLLTGAILGPVGAVMICSTFMSLYRFMRQSHRLLAIAAATGFLAMIIVNGLYHAAFMFYHPDVYNRLIIESGGEFSQFSLYKGILNFGLFANNLGKAGFLLFGIWLVTKSRRSIRTVLLLLVAPLLFFMQPWIIYLPAPIGGVIAGIYSNLVLWLFFLFLALLIPPKKLTGK